MSLERPLPDDCSHGRFPGESLLVVNVLVTGEPRVHGLAKEAGKLVLHVPAGSVIGYLFTRRFGEAEHSVKLPYRQKPGIACHLGALEYEPQMLSLIHISEPTRLGMISYAVFCLKKK